VIVRTLRLVISLLFVKNFLKIFLILLFVIFLKNIFLSKHDMIREFHWYNPFELLV